MANQIKIGLPLSGNWIPLANITITDTNPHLYAPGNITSDGHGIDIAYLGNSLGAGGKPIKTYALWILNNENQDLSVTPLCNIVNDGSIFYNVLVPTYTVPQGSTDWRMFPFSSYPVEYLTLQLKYNTAPTYTSVWPNFGDAGVYAVLYIYYG